MSDKVLYLCNQKRCVKCSYPICILTSDINYAKNFHKDGFGAVVEDVKEDKERIMQTNNTLIIGVGHGSKDISVVTVGRLINGGIEMVNVFKGEEAVEIYQTLTADGK